VTVAAVATVTGADEGSISYVQIRRTVQSRAATGDLSRGRRRGGRNRLREGPCLDAIWDQQVVRVDDMRSKLRWPRFAAEAAALGVGVGSSLSFQLMAEADSLGSLNLYARTPRAFTEESIAVGLALAAHAAVAITGAQREANLRTAIDNRDLIGQAKGILMERHGVTADQASAVLLRASQETHRKVVDIALELSGMGAIAGPRRGGRGGSSKAQ
jgi:GAF domain-containing protein